MLPRPYLQDKVDICVKRESFKILYETDFDEPVIEANILSSDFLKGCKSTQLPVRKKCDGWSKEKKEKLMRNIEKLIPDNRMIFWRNLPEE